MSPDIWEEKKQPRCGKALILPPPGLPHLLVEGEPVRSWVPVKAVPPVLVSSAANPLVSGFR